MARTGNGISVDVMNYKSEIRLKAKFVYCWVDTRFAMFAMRLETKDTSREPNAKQIRPIPNEKKQKQIK